MNAIPPALATIARDNGLAVDDPLVQTLAVAQAQLAPLLAEAAAINVTAADQLTEMKQARVARLKLKELRVATETQRKIHKERSLREGRAVDALANWVKGQIEPAEARLQMLEEFAVRAEAARKAKVKAEREAEILPYIGSDVAFHNFEEMPEDAYQNFLSTSKKNHEETQAVLKKLEAEKVEAEKRRVAEQKRLKLENERLADEAFAAEEKLKAERKAAAVANLKLQEAHAAELAKAKKAEEKALAEKVEAESVRWREQAERDRLAKVEADKIAAQKKAEKDAAKAPDKDKLLAYAKALLEVPTPTIKDPEADAILDEFKERVGEWVLWLKNQVKAL